MDCQKFINYRSLVLVIRIAEFPAQLSMCQTNALFHYRTNAL